MKIVEFFTSNNKEHWLSEIEKCDWGAGQYLHQILKEKNLKNMVGEAAIVPMLVDGNMSIFLPGIPVCMRNTAMNSTGWIRISRAGIPVCTGKLWRWKVRTRIVATRMEPMPARHRQCLSENTEKRNSFRSMTNCMRPIPSKRRRKYWGRMYRRASRYWRNVLH